MTEKQLKVVKGFIELTETERKEVLEFLIRYSQADFVQRTRLFSNLSESRTVGVTSSNICPCCGK